MKEGNTDVRYTFSSMIDSVGELFGGRITLTELMNMDMPMVRSLVKVRLENLEKRKSHNGDDLEKMLKEFVP